MAKIIAALWLGFLGLFLFGVVCYALYLQVGVAGPIILLGCAFLVCSIIASIVVLNDD